MREGKYFSAESTDNNFCKKMSHWLEKFSSGKAVEHCCVINMQESKEASEKLHADWESQHSENQSPCISKRIIIPKSKRASNYTSCWMVPTRCVCACMYLNCSYSSGGFAIPSWRTPWTEPKPCNSKWNGKRQAFSETQRIDQQRTFRFCCNICISNPYHEANQKSPMQKPDMQPAMLSRTPSSSRRTSRGHAAGSAQAAAGVS